MNPQTHWHKRVPLEMVTEYTAKGWRMHGMEGRIAVLIWPHEGAPS